MRKYLFVFLLASLVVDAGEIKKWVDEKGNVHYGDRPPAGQNTEIVEVNGGSKVAIKKDNDVLLGKWRTDSVVYNGQSIPSMIYIFDKTTFRVEGKTEQVAISTYSYRNDVITVAIGTISQNYTIVDENTVSYQAIGFGVQLLHRVN